MTPKFKHGDKLTYDGPSEAPKNAMALSGKPYLTVDYIKSGNDGYQWIVFKDEPMRECKYYPEDYPNSWMIRNFILYQAADTNILPEELFNV